jgi:hypothetical protein
MVALIVLFQEFVWVSMSHAKQHAVVPNVIGSNIPNIGHPCPFNLQHQLCPIHFHIPPYLIQNQLTLPDICIGFLFWLASDQSFN